MFYPIGGIVVGLGILLEAYLLVDSGGRAVPLMQWTDWSQRIWVVVSLVWVFRADSIAVRLLAIAFVLFLALAIGYGIYLAASGAVLDRVTFTAPFWMPYAIAIFGIAYIAGCGMAVANR